LIELSKILLSKTLWEEEEEEEEEEKEGVGAAYRYWLFRF